ncbi:MAG: vitamin K epoxide reductase family protein [Bradyrhizobium sp.]
MSTLTRDFPVGASVARPPAPDQTGTANRIDRVSLAPYAMLALALIGIAVAFYDSYALYNGQALWCPPPIDGCNIVASSPYAHILDLPVGYFGVVYYLYMLALAALLAFDPYSRALRVGALIYTALGVAFSIYFMVLQLSFIHAFCIYCLVSAVTTLLLLSAALWHLRATRPRA